MGWSTQSHQVHVSQAQTQLAWRNDKWQWVMMWVPMICEHLTIYLSAQVVFCQVSSTNTVNTQQNCFAWEPVLWSSCTVALFYWQWFTIHFYGIKSTFYFKLCLPSSSFDKKFIILFSFKELSDMCITPYTHWGFHNKWKAGCAQTAVIFPAVLNFLKEIISIFQVAFTPLLGNSLDLLKIINSNSAQCCWLHKSWTDL